MTALEAIRALRKAGLSMAAIREKSGVRLKTLQAIASGNNNHDRVETTQRLQKVVDEVGRAR